MKLNHRDRVLITILFVAIVWAVGIFVFIVPAFQELGTKKDELNSLQVKLSEKQDQIEKDKDLPQRIEEEFAKSEELAKNFYNEQTTQQATDTVDQLLDDQKLTNTNMKIGELKVTTLKPFTYVSKDPTADIDNKATEYEKIGASSVVDSRAQQFDPQTKTTNDGAQYTVDPRAGLGMRSYEISFHFEGVYGDVQKFCEQLTKNVPNSMLVSKLEINDVTGIVREGEDSSSSSSAPESKKEDGKEKTIDDNEIEGDITVTIIIIKKPTKPEF
jgi:hypothetical protein